MKEGSSMTDVCHLYELELDAARGFNEFLRDNVSEVRFVNKMELQITTITGETHWFMGEYKYTRWSRGRTYLLNSKWYHSGYEMREW